MARFYETTYIKPNSAYVPLPLDAMASKLQTMQAAQDNYRSTIEAFDKPFANLPIDERAAMEAKQWVQGQLGSLRELDYNDAANRDKIYGTIRDVRDFYSPQGQGGLLQSKVDQYTANKKHITETYKDNPTQMGYMLSELDRQFMTPDNALDYDNKALRRNDLGQWENTQVGAPDDWTWVDPQERVGHYATQALKEAGIIQQNWSGTPVEATKIYNEVIKDQVTKQKLDYTMRMMMASDPELQKSAGVLSGGDESRFWNEETGTWDSNTLLGRMAEGFAAAKVTSDLKTYHTTVTDRVKEEIDIEKKKKEMNAFTISGTIPGSTTSVDAQKNGENIASIKERIKNTNPNTAEGKLQLEKLNEELAIAESYQKQIMDAGRVNGNSSAVIKSEWENILETQKDFDDDETLSTSWGQSDTFNDIITSAEFRNKIKTQQDYEKWMRGEIKLNTANMGTYDSNGNPIDYTTQEAAAKGEAVKRYSEGVIDGGGELNITYDANALSGSGVTTVNEGLNNFILNNPTGFTTATGDFQDWKEDAEEDLPKKADGSLREDIKMTTSILNKDIDGRDGYYVSYVDGSGNLLKSTVIYPTDPSTATNAKNTAGNDLVLTYENNNTSAGKAYKRTGEAMVATSASPAAATASTSKLTTYANSVPDPTVNGTSTTYTQSNGTSGTPTQTVVLSSGNSVEIKYNIVKQRDGNGNIVTKYQPLFSDNSKVFSGTEGYSGLNPDGTFTNIEDMQIALAKDDLNVPPGSTMKEDNLKPNK